MPSMALTVPYMRTSPVHIPRRDLVLATADSLYLRVTVVDSDDPCSQALDLTGGIGGPTLAMIVWADVPGQYWHEYGMWHPVAGQVLWTGIGTISDAIGAFDVVMPVNTMACWPRRCGFALRLDYDGGLGSEVLAQGTLHVRHVPGSAAVLTAVPITTWPLDPITTD
jgi:hypothetical protein